jgi:uncharacterized protein YkwD
MLDRNVSTQRTGIVIWIALALALSAGCRKTDRAGGPPPPAEVGPVDRPKGPVPLEEAGRYVLALVNRDRAASGLGPVVWDETAAKAALRHAEDMARHGYAGHWGSDGSVPEERYTDAGGEDFVHENAACLFDAQIRDVQSEPLFDPVELEKIEEVFITEVPPADGHRRNILKPAHTGLGVGISLAVGVKSPCLAQEFVDDYGDYTSLPREARLGQTITIAGEVREPAEFGGVGIGRIDPARPLSGDQLLELKSYPVPDPYVLYTPPGFKTPKPVTMDGKRFSIDVEIGKGNTPGRYEVSIWAQMPDAPKGQMSMVSLRTISVR